MLTPQTLEDLLERLRQLTSRGVGEAAEALQGEQLALAPWEGSDAAVRAASIQAVAFANHRGGDLVFGIEADGRITGCPGADAVRLIREVFARTRPSIVADVWSYPTPDGVLLVMTVPEGATLHATSEGLRVRRAGRANLPITPDQDAQMLGARGEVDFTDRTLPGIRLSDLEPMQLIYLREILRRKNDQSELLELTDEELLQALGLVGEGGAPRVAALILLGSRRVLRERLPQTEVVYIHFDEREEADVQEQLYLPLLHTLSRLQDLIEARNRFTTLRQGLFHFQIKDFDEEVYREALVNALVHRDYSRRDGSVHVAHRSDRLEISNPGGLIGGVSIDNILYHPPRHRNRRLTEVLQQLGLMERAGMGVNRLYRYLLRRGKAPPEYQVTAESVHLTLQGGNFDETFASFINEEEARGRLFGLDMLIVLSSLKRAKVLDRATAAKLTQRPDRAIGETLSRMVEAGYLERVGAGRSSAYRLSSRVYDKLGSKVGYFRDRGLSRRRQRALILEVAEELGGLTRDECQELCGVDAAEATRLLDELVEEGRLRADEGRYRLA
jgi:ATP-dependent DNA helicase RecG